ncbi:dihydrodipicolinate synthase family protein [Alkalihalobacillus sp. TS-13]|uniref:dihydrodipicolinate synthase family protein n=1 Tax=Alkalihalobacillus sp. TS-13 TaxID=2842455 RepID=UPI0034D97F75
MQVSSHLATKDFLDIFQNVRENDHIKALQILKRTYPITTLLFQETNPDPLKYYLYKKGLIRSPETRLPGYRYFKRARKKARCIAPEFY